MIGAEAVKPGEAGLPSPYGVVARADVARIRRFQLFLVCLDATIALGILLTGDESWAAYTSVGAALVGLTTSLVWLRISREEDARIRWVVAMGPAHFIGGAFILYYIGFFSPGPAVWLVAVYTFATVRSRAVALYVYVNAVVFTGVPMLLLALGVIDDRGKLSPHTSREILLFVVVATQVGIAAAYSFGRQSARVLLDAIDDVERARRAILQREALLEEANADLDRVLHARAGPATGTKLGAWTLGALLGRGGMGEVYRAVQEEGGTAAAVKLLIADPVADPDVAERFKREAEALARVDHPNVVRLLDVGDGWIAMEHLEGIDLAALLRKRRALQSSDVMKLVAEVAAALEAAREASIVHRDLKPQNIFFVEERNVWKVLDFGLSKIEQRGNTLTQGMPVGTPAYMAPEQVEGSKEVDHRADVFALGLVAYRAITGRPAFSAEEPAAVLFDVLFEQPPRPSELAPVDIDIDFALALALAKTPADRLDRAIDLASAIEDAYRGALSPALRTKAQRLLAVHGWGERRLGSVRNLPAQGLRNRDRARSLE